LLRANRRPGRRSLTGSVKLLIGVDTDGSYKGRLSLCEGEGEGCLQRVVVGSMTRTPHLSPLPLARGEANNRDGNDGRRTRPFPHIALKSYSQGHHRCVIIHFSPHENP